ncbi:hypothetical protein [Kitasatospora sp. NPDC059327]|uniref:hypothetical protein n=1 Tax=Kitasatospora sp. NPDC059327 TaxID=3346803 RepID=UPI00368A2B32
MTRTPEQVKEHADALFGFARARLLETAAAAGIDVPAELVTALVQGAYALGRVDGAVGGGDIVGATSPLNTLHRLAGNWSGHPDSPDAGTRQWHPAGEAETG